MPPYSATFPVGTIVRVAGEPALERFLADWTFHDPLSVDQLRFAGVQSVVKEVGFYHGGAALYTLDGVPGIWHEQCLLGVL
jgi:hypothetical protein